VIDDEKKKQVMNVFACYCVVTVPICCVVQMK